jgi:L-amino acid N-acyltransferase
MGVEPLAALVDAGRAWVAVADGELIGFVAVDVVDGCGHVEEVAVAPAWSGRGIGSVLLERAAGWAVDEGSPALTLTTFRDVPWNRPFYERRGFSVVEEDALSAAQRALLVEEEHHGLVRELRVFMRRDLGASVAVRDATAGDLRAITGLFNALIPTTTVAWRDHLADDTEMITWFEAQAQAGNPVLVAELGGEVAGYTTWTWFRGGERFPGYRHTRELTIHVDERHHGKGIGRALIEALVERARATDVHALVAGVDAANDASVEFHRRLGFEVVATMPEVGRKFDRWLDLVLLQRRID